MATADNSQTTIIERMEGLTPDMIQEVIDFIDFLKIKRRDRMYSPEGALLLQQEGLRMIWGSDSEDLYEL